jgi:L,D-transpeptidase catalytic domain
MCRLLMLLACADAAVGAAIEASGAASAPTNETPPVGPSAEAGAAIEASASAAEPLAANPAPGAAPSAVDPFAAWLAAPIPVAGGFAAPMADACGSGCWSASTEAEVRTIGAGIVREVGPDTLVTEHLWYDDQVRRTAQVRWRGLTPSVAVGATLAVGQPIGRATKVQLDAPALGPMELFIAGRPRLPMPQTEPVLAVISHELGQMQLYVDGALTGAYEVGFGQAEGDKELRGDNRTPKGVYFVVAKSTGPFEGPFGAWYGGHWIKLSYPNAWDAARGVDAGLFGVETQRRITRDFWARREPAQGTKLGGGIGLHGWVSEWDAADGRALSWGCVVTHLRDVAAIYAALPQGAMVALI